jgi:hypothetical protein
MALQEPQVQVVQQAQAVHQELLAQAVQLVQVERLAQQAQAAPPA